MDLIAIAQQTGDVSPEAYQRLALRGTLQPPQMLGVEELLQRLATAEAAANPFANGGGAAAAPSPSGGGGGGGYAQFRPPAVIPPSMSSPARSQVCRIFFLKNFRSIFALQGAVEPLAAVNKHSAECTPLFGVHIQPLASPNLH